MTHRRRQVTRRVYSKREAERALSDWTNQLSLFVLTVLAIVACLILEAFR